MNWLITLLDDNLQIKLFFIVWTRTLQEANELALSLTMKIPYTQIVDVEPLYIKEHIKCPISTLQISKKEY
jgi:hypothetical protein